MSYNSFEYYEQLRQYQLHLQKLQNPEKKVPTHEAFRVPQANMGHREEFDRNQKHMAIERENEHIMQKLVNINRRKPELTKSSSTLSLPSLKKKHSIPQYTTENNHIAKKIIECKSHINTRGNIERYRSVEKKKRSLEHYQNEGGSVINRKKYLAELMLLKKMRVGEQMQGSRLTS